MGNKVVERQLNRPPLRVGRENLAIGLPRPGHGVRPQMNAVLLTIAEYVEFDPAPGAGIDDPTVRREIEGDLNKAAIVLEADVATHADGGPAGDCVADHSPFGDTTHDLIGEEPPFAPYHSNGWLAAQVVNDIGHRPRGLPWVSGLAATGPDCLRERIPNTYPRANGRVMLAMPREGFHDACI